MDHYLGLTLTELGDEAAKQGIDPVTVLADLLTQRRRGYVDIEAAATHLGRSVYTVRRYAQLGKIPAVKLGRAWMFKLAEIDAHLAAPKPLQSAQSRGRRRK